MAESAPLRREQDPAYQWRLEDLYPGVEQWEADLRKLSTLVEALPSFRGRLWESPELLLAFFRHEDQLSLLADRLGNYAHRKADEDTADPLGQSLTDRLAKIFVRAGELSDFERPELLSAPEDTVTSFFEQMPELEEYRRSLTSVRRKKAHILDAAGEKLLASAGEITAVPEKTYGLLCDADLTYPDAVDGAGAHHAVTHGTFISLLRSEDRALRKSAYESCYGVYGSHKNTLACLLSGQMKSLHFHANARKYPSPLAAALDGSEVPESVYHTLIEAVNSRMALMGRYTALRKKLLGLDTLHYYDLYVPLLPNMEKKIPYAQACRTVREALKPLGEEYGAVLAQGLSGGWVDVYENRGKRSGAYSAGARVHPYVLLNYAEDLDSQFTLAHEMGHAMHSWYSNKNQPISTSDYAIFVAEVASTCNEALLMEYLLNHTEEKKERAYLLNHFLEQVRATLYRQTMFAEFERDVCRMEGEGIPLTAEALSDAYGKLLEAYFCGTVEADDHIVLEWARIPHFYYDFYVYQYATGFSAAIALSRRILSGEPGAVEEYLRFLSGGCSKDPIALLRDAGVDMTSPEPVLSALELFESRLEELERLAEEL